MRRTGEGLKLADGWSHEVRDGYFYYQTKVEPGTAVPFFSGIVVPRRWKEERTGMAFELCVSAQAMEADYLESGQKLLFTEEPEEEWLFQPGSLQAMSD